MRIDDPKPTSRPIEYAAPNVKLQSIKDIFSASKVKRIRSISDQQANLELSMLGRPTGRF